MTRVSFNGVVEGSVLVRTGETEAQAISRAEQTINDVLMRSCRLLSRADDDARYGPVVGLEPSTAEGR